MNEIEAWIAETRAALETGAQLTQMPNNTHPLAHQQRPTALYNSMVHPIVPYAMRGALWYQGESNLREGMLYHEKDEGTHQRLARSLGTKAIFRSISYNSPLSITAAATRTHCSYPKSGKHKQQHWHSPNTGMAVTTDIGNLRDILRETNKMSVDASHYGHLRWTTAEMM